MKTMRIPLLCALGVALLGIILGSFFDLQISQAIASPTNGFGLTISALGPTIAFASVAAMGGGFIAFALKGQYPLGLKILFFVLAAACYGVSVYYPGGEYFGVNGFYGAAPKWVGYLIVFIPEALAMVGGYFLFKDCQNKNMWIIFCIIIVILCLVLLGCVTVLKGILHRPRYRLISVTEEVSFHQWWQPCPEYKDLINEFGFKSDDFKSYPSGHTAEASILLVAIPFLPLANRKFAKHHLLLFLLGAIVVCLVAFARILAAAHFLSDVSTGAFFQIFFTVIANEIVMRIKALQIPE